MLFRKVLNKTVVADDLLCSLEQGMVAANDFAQVESDIGDLVVQDPAEIEEGGWVAHNTFRLADGTVPVRILDILRGHFVQTNGRYRKRSACRDLVLVFHRDGGWKEDSGHGYGTRE